MSTLDVQRSGMQLAASSGSEPGDQWSRRDSAGVSEITTVWVAAHIYDEELYIGWTAEDGRIIRKRPRSRPMGWFDEITSIDRHHVFDPWLDGCSPIRLDGMNLNDVWQAHDAVARAVLPRDIACIVTAYARPKICTASVVWDGVEREAHDIYELPFVGFELVYANLGGLGACPLSGLEININQGDVRHVALTLMTRYIIINGDRDTNGGYEIRPF